jgi:hypothetical protein
VLGVAEEHRHGVLHLCTIRPAVRHLPLVLQGGVRLSYARVERRDDEAEPEVVGMRLEVRLGVEEGDPVAVLFGTDPGSNGSTTSAGTPPESAADRVCSARV